MIVTAANGLVFYSMVAAASDGSLELGRMVTFATTALSTSMIAFGGLSGACCGRSTVPGWWR
jgi:ATP-binding cassette subfamily B protein